MLSADSAFDIPNTREDPFFSFRQTPVPVLVDENAPAVTNPAQVFLHEAPEPVFQPVEQQLFPHPPLTPKPRKPYPSEVRQLTQTPGNPIPLKHHGPFRIQPLHVQGPAIPTTTVAPALVSSLPPRFGPGPTPAATQTVISTTFEANRFQPGFEPQPPRHYHPSQTVSQV